VRIAEDLRIVLDELSAAGVPHMVVGALAVEAYGIVRSTLDIDIQVLTPETPSKARSVVLGLIVEEWATDRTFGQEVMIGHVASSPVPVELFFTTHWFPRQALERRVGLRSAALGREIPVPQREDIILLKTAFHAAPWRSRRKAAQDAVDIEALLEYSPTLDEQYLRENAEKLGVWPTLKEFLDEASSRRTS
jgi:hypothetical protein